MNYPPDFQSWPLERRNAWFADEAAAYRETRQKVNGNGGKDASENQWRDPGSVATVAGTTADPLPLFPPLEKAEPYPVEALGATLSRAAKAIASKVRSPRCIRGVGREQLRAVCELQACRVSVEFDLQLATGRQLDGLDARYRRGDSCSFRAERPVHLLALSNRHPLDDQLIETEIAAVDGFWQCQALDLGLPCI